MKLSTQQQYAYDDIGRWLKSGSQEYVLAGFAGTGKTTIAKALASQVDGKIYFVSFTGKAALNMQRKGNENAMTLHKLIYTPKNKSQKRLIELRDQLEKDPQNERLKFLLDEEVKNVNRPSFNLNLESLARSAALIIVDEYSMMTQGMVDDLRQLAVKILYLGDPAQLPPVGTENNLEPDYFLTEIHRQALDSPILRAATDVRNGVRLTYHQEEGFRYGPKEDFFWDDYNNADQVITGRNINRTTLNNKFRDKLGFNSPYPMISDKIVCLKNDHEIGIMNGMIGYSLNDANESWGDDATFFIDFESEGQKFLGLDAWPNRFKNPKAQPEQWEMKELQHFDYGYAITCHKAQGSEWDNVMIFDDGFQINVPEMRRRWLYTAITRASKNISIVSAY